MAGARGWARRRPRPRRGAASLLRSLLTVAAPSAVLVLLARVSGLLTLPEPRVDGWVLALAAVACGLARPGCETGRDALLPRWKPDRRLVIAVAVTGLGLATAGVAAYVSSTEPRAAYYGVAWHEEYTSHPLLGTGAGTFALYWGRSGHVASRGGALDVHSLYLETLAELGRSVSCSCSRPCSIRYAWRSQDGVRPRAGGGSCVLGVPVPRRR